MSQSIKFRKEYRKLLNRLVAEIRMALHKHDEIEIVPEIKNPPIYEHHDDVTYVISDVTINHAIITTRDSDDEIDRMDLEHIDLQILIYVLEQLEVSLESAKKFLAQ